jgi:CIC family chloride channel protein
VLLGGLLLVLPQMYGVGYPVLVRSVQGHYAIAFVLTLLAAKVVATSLTIAIGGSGGVFAPSLFIGAMLGSAFGQIAHGVIPGLTAPSGAYALVGMGAVFAGASRAPITAVIVIFELTGEYSIVLPLMLAVVFATSIGGRLSPGTIYTLKLRRRGVFVDRPRVVSVMRTVTVSDAMQPLPEPLSPDASLEAVIGRFTSSREETVPVINGGGVLLGVLSVADVEQQALAPPVGDGCAGHLAHLPRELRVGDSLEDAVRALSLGDDAGVPVLAACGSGVVGWVTHRDVLRAYHRERERLAPAPRPIAALNGAAP